MTSPHALRMFLSRICLAAALLLLAGCERAEGPTLQGLEPVAARLAGPGAYDCGSAETPADRPEVNCCIANRFAQGLPVYGIYAEPEVVGYVSAVAMVSAGPDETYYLYFEGDPGDLEHPVHGEISAVPCWGAQLNDDVCNSETFPFGCLISSD